MDVNIGICDRDETYVLGISAMLEEVLPKQCRLSCFTSADEIRKAIRNHTIDLLIITESSFDRQMECEGISNILLLTETEDPPQADAKVDRFQKAELIVREIIEKMSELLNITAESTGVQKKHRMKLISLYSPIRRSLQTTLGMAIGELLAEKSRVLYLPLDCFSGIELPRKENDKNDLLDLLYYFDCCPQKLPLKIPVISQKVRGMSLVPPVNGFDLQERKAESWMELIEEIRDSELFDYILLDLPDVLPGLLDLLMNSDRIYTIARDEAISVRKMEAYENWLWENEYTTILQKTMKLKLPKLSEIPVRVDMLQESSVWPYATAIVSEDSALKEQTGEG